MSRVFNPQSNRPTKLVPTDEQINIVNQAIIGSNIAIQAYAGAAKTSTLLMVAEEVVKPTLMICFNKSIADEAGKKFPSNVTCQTINSLAWRAIVKSSNSKFGKKLGNSFKLDEMDLPYEVTKQNEDKAIGDRLFIRECVTGWCASSFDSVERYFIETIKDKDNLIYYLPLAYAFWTKVIDQNSPVTMTHDVYLKLFQLSNPVLPFDLIMVDEFQDFSPVNLAIIITQLDREKQVIVVGDRWQSIYAFRGAIDAFSELAKLRKDFINLRLSISFRFGDKIAGLANDLLYIGGEDIPLIGGRTNKDTTIRSTAYLYRNNLNTLGKLLEFAELGQKVNFIGDLKDLWSKAYHVTALLADKSVKFPNKDLSSYRTKKDLLAAANRIVDIKTLLGLVSYINANGGVYNFSKKVTDNIDSDSKITISTIHRSKGLEFNLVVLGSDCLQIRKDDTGYSLALARDQTLELIYIGITRAIDEVIVEDDILGILNQKEALKIDFLRIRKKTSIYLW